MTLASYSLKLLFCTVGENIKWQSHLGNFVIPLAFSVQPVLALLEIHLEGTFNSSARGTDEDVIWAFVCNEIWTQPKCSSGGKW